MNYVYLVWVYFLFYIGAGYPSYYYPYIIATLLDSVPQECGGTGTWYSSRHGDITLCVLV